MASEFFQYLVATKNKAAFLFALYESLGNEPGRIVDATFATLAEIAARFGVVLTDSQVRKRVAEHEAEGIFEIVPRRERGRFDLYVYRIATSGKGDDAEKMDVSTPLFDFYGAETLDAAPDRGTRRRCGNGCGNGDETGTGTKTACGAVVAVAKGSEIPELAPEYAPECAPVVAPAEPVPGVGPRGVPYGEKNAPQEENNINTNKKINKPAREFEVSATGSETPRTSDVRSALDFGSEKVAAIRRRVVREIWEPELHADLVDRIVFGLVRGIVGRGEWRGIVAEAKNRRALYERSREGRGAPTLWRTVAVKVKSAFDAAGWTWTPTSNRREPEPEERSARPVVDSVEVGAERDSLDDAKRIAAGFEIEDARLPLNALARKVVAVRNVRGIAAQTTAIAIRNALKRIEENAGGAVVGTV